MPLTAAQRTRAIAALRPRLKKPCPHCGARSWRLVDVVAPTLYEDVELFVGERTIPMLLVMCGSCSYVAHFSAIALGLVDAGPAQE